MRKRPDTLPCIGIVANPAKPNCRAAVRRAAALVARSGRTVLTDEATAQVADIPAQGFTGARELGARADLLLVFGGDGTMLRVARETAGLRTPILGINVGSLGFLTAASVTELPGVLTSLWAGRFRVEPHSLIEARGQADGRALRQVALNDFVISRSTVTRLIELQVSVDGAVLTCYRCDGLIVSSPTGSTAYSLAAGGALVNPDAEVFALTPICPHTLSNRSVILNLHSVVEVQVLTSTVEVILAADGQVQSRLACGDVVAIRRSRHAVPLVRLAGTSFFETLRHKLRWSGSTV